MVERDSVFWKKLTNLLHPETIHLHLQILLAFVEGPDERLDASRMSFSLSKSPVLIVFQRHEQKLITGLHEKLNFPLFMHF